MLKWQVCFGDLEDEMQPVLCVYVEFHDNAFGFLRELPVGEGVRRLLLGGTLAVLFRRVF